MITKTHKDFILWFAVIFLATFTGLYLLGLVPSELASSNQTSILDALPSAGLPVIESTTTLAVKRTFQGEYPTHITIPKIGVNASISNPSSTDTDILDNDLTHGAVHYPGSGLLADGNLFLFGHSTNWSVVQNQAYKTFNDLNNLEAGDLIQVTGQTQVFTYKVTSVRLADSDQIWVDLSGDKQMLTLSTCNTFGQKQERYVVQADFVSSQPL